MTAHDRLASERRTVAALDTQYATVRAEMEAAYLDFEQADAELTRLAGLERLGEATKAAVKAAHQRRQAALDAHAAASGASDILFDRRAAARDRVEAAESVFFESAADMLLPLYQQLRSRVHSLADELARTLIELARTDAITSRIPLGTRSGHALMRSIGDPLQAVQDRHNVGIVVSLPVELRRLNEREVLARIAPASEAAAE